MVCRMRVWTRQLRYEDRNRALGLCARSKGHGYRDARSKNLCAACLRQARELMRDHRRPVAIVLLKKPAQSVREWRKAA
jgi:hypothetical protein